MLPPFPGPLVDHPVPVEDPHLITLLTPALQPHLLVDLARIPQLQPALPALQSLVVALLQSPPQPPVPPLWPCTQVGNPHHRPLLHHSSHNHPRLPLHPPYLLHTPPTQLLPCNHLHTLHTLHKYQCLHPHSHNINSQPPPTLLQLPPHPLPQLLKATQVPLLLAQQDHHPPKAPNPMEYLAPTHQAASLDTLVLVGNITVATLLASTHLVQREVIHPVQVSTLVGKGHMDQVRMGHTHPPLAATRVMEAQCLMRSLVISIPQGPHMVSILHRDQGSMASTDQGRGHHRDSTPDMIPAAIPAISPGPHPQALLSRTEITKKLKILINLFYIFVCCNIDLVSKQLF